MKKTAAVLQLAAVLLLCGCSNANELGNNDIITVFYADYNEYTLFELSAETANFKSEKNAEQRLVSAYGETIEEAYANLLSEFHSSPYSGHAGILVLGDGLCRYGLKDTLEFFSDIGSISPNINIFLTEDKFSDFEPNEIYNAARNKMLPSVPLYSLFLPSNKTAVIPVIECRNGNLRKSGGIISEDMNFKYYITEKEYELYRLITNNYENKYTDRPEIVYSHCKIRNKNGLLQVYAELSLKNTSGKDTSKMEYDVQNEINNFLNKAREEGFEELFGFKKWDAVETSVSITVTDTGKQKNRKE